MLTVQTYFFKIMINHQLYCLSADAFIETTYKQCFSVVAFKRAGRPYGKIIFKSFDASVIQIYKSLLVTFTCNDKGFIFKIDIVDVETAKLCKSQSAV